MEPVAFVFSGQGAQTPGMGKAWMDGQPAAAKVFELAEALRPGTQRQCFEGTKEELSQTVNTQPCLFCVDLAAAEALRAEGIAPAAVAGFSLGEIPALAFSGMLSAEDAFRLVCVRAEAMQACAEQNPGGMVAVLGLEAAVVEALCQEIGDAYPVNYNCPGQIVVTAKEDKLSQVRDAVKAAGGKALPLAVSGPFHSPMMAEAEAAVASFLQTSAAMQAPTIPVYANVTAMPYEAPYADLTSAQVTHPVRWEETLRHMYGEGIRTFIEVGIGKTLSGFIRKTLPDARVFQVQDPQSLQETLNALSKEPTC